MNKPLFRIIVALFLFTSLGSCKKLTEDMYVDPNNPQENQAVAENMLPGIALANGLIQSGEIARLTGMWVGYFDGVDRQYISLNSYSATSGDFDSPWDNLYVGAYAQADLAAEKAMALNNRKVASIAKIHKALAVGTAATLWGDVPFSEANQYDKTRTPKYDGQSAALNAAITLLDEAIADIKDGSGVWKDKSKDILHNGDLGKWEKVAYSLKARFYLQLKDYAKAEENAQKGVDAGSELILPHTGDQGAWNAYFYFMYWDRPGYMVGSQEFFEFMLARKNEKTDESARIEHYFLYEYNDEGELDWVDANYETGIFAADVPYTLVGAAETKLIIAEASARANNTSAALEALNSHRADLGFAAYETADFNNGGLENKDGIAADKALLREILEEKYVSMYGSIEGFNDLRRTWKDDVRVQVPIKNSTATSIPMRLLYPQNEINTNPNVPSPLPGLFDPTPVNK
jgi:hypothetical protein